MSLKQLLPTRFRVALHSGRNDARAVMRALHEPRFRAVRERQGTIFHPEPSILRVQREPSEATSPSRTTPGDRIVEFAASGVTLALGPDETILEAGLRNGIDLLFSCTLGGCGACMLQIREGEVDYDDPDAICLTDEELNDGYCLACVGRPRGRVVLEA